MIKIISKSLQVSFVLLWIDQFIGKKSMEVRPMTFHLSSSLQSSLVVIQFDYSVQFCSALNMIVYHV